MPTLVDRRTFLTSAGAAFVAGLMPKNAMALDRTDAVFATAFRAADDGYGLALLSERGELISASVLPDRAHGLAASPVTGDVVAFARRPGTFAAIFHRRGQETVIHTPEGRHFFGHGCFSPDGTLLYASENDIDTGQGVIAIHDATAHYKRIGEFPAFGIGTHDLTINFDGSRLIAANGGIRTHPDFGRTKLNLDHMQPSMALIDTAHGSLVERHTMPAGLEKLSCRHADIASDGSVWFACQYEGPVSDRPPVIGRMRPGHDLDLVTLPEPAASLMANYVGAIAVDRRRGLVAATSPRGGATIILDARDGRMLSAARLPETSGVAAGPDGFLFSSDTGRIGGRQDERAWDQHIVALR